jgi:hypothetical protein
METAVSYARVLQEPLPNVEVGVRAERAARRGGEDVSLGLPVGTGLDPLLLSLMSSWASSARNSSGRSRDPVAVSAPLDAYLAM